MTGCRRGSNKRIAEESQLKRIRRSHFHSGNVVNIDEGGREGNSCNFAFPYRVFI